MFTISLTTRSYEVDSFGHVNNAVYLNYLEHCRMQWLYAHGITTKDFQRLQLFPVVVNIDINYQKEISDGMRITVSVEESSRSERKLVFYQTIQDEAGQTCADARVTVVWINQHRKVVPLPITEFPTIFKDSDAAQN